MEWLGQPVNLICSCFSFPCSKVFCRKKYKVTSVEILIANNAKKFVPSTWFPVIWYMSYILTCIIKFCEYGLCITSAPHTIVCSFNLFCVYMYVGLAAGHD